MMKRSAGILLCAILGLVLLGLGLLVPAHLRAVDRSVIEAAGRNTTTIVERGMALAGKKNLGAARLYLQVVRTKALPEREKLTVAVEDLATQQPDLGVLGHDEPGLEILFDIKGVAAGSNTVPITDFLVRQDNRQRALDLLAASANPVVQELLRFRTRTNTAIFSPSPSASGQALDASVSICGNGSAIFIISTIRLRIPGY